MVHTGPPQTGTPRCLEQSPQPDHTYPHREAQASTGEHLWAERAPSLSHIPITVYFHRCYTTVLGSGLIVDTYREGDAKSLERAGTEREENGIGGVRGRCPLRKPEAMGSLACHDVGGFY